jgi:hypothetical protein
VKYDAASGASGPSLPTRSTRRAGAESPRYSVTKGSFASESASPIAEVGEASAQAARQDFREVAGAARVTRTKFTFSAIGARLAIPKTGAGEEI